MVYSRLYGVILAWLLTSGGYATYAQASLSITPAYVYITDQAPHGSFILRNDGTEQMEVIVYARFGVIEANTKDFSTHVTLGEAGLLGNLAEKLLFFPERLLLTPGSERVVRYMATSPEEFTSGAHIALLHFEMQERAAVARDQVPAVATALSIVYNLVAPIILIKGRGAPKLQARVLHAADESIHLLLTNETPFPFVGGVSVMQNAQRLGRAESAVYTRRRLEIPLSATLSDSPLSLTFDNEYTGLSAALQRLFVVPAPIDIAR